MKPGASRQEGSADRQILAGPVERVTFHNSDSGFCMLSTRERGHRDLVTEVGDRAFGGCSPGVDGSHTRSFRRCMAVATCRPSIDSAAPGIFVFGLGVLAVRDSPPVA